MVQTFIVDQSSVIIKIILSKLDTMKQFIRNNAVPVASSALISMVVDYAVSTWLLSKGVSPGLALFFSAIPASILFFSYWVLRWIGRKNNNHLTMLIMISFMVLFLRGGVYETIILIGWSVQASIIAVVIATVAHSYIGIAFINLIKRNSLSEDSPARWKAIAFALAGYILVLRFYYIGSIELLPQEAYYWLYARHLDLGYLDHPPMVAWIIWANSLIFGNSEFAIRFGAFSLWVLTAFFCFRLTRNLFGKTAALGVIPLLAALPFFFFIGFLMTPDAPLTACWAGALYFLERALLGRQRLSWWGAGICMGLGLLSKYTIALLFPAALIFILIDRDSRPWLLRPEPYGAVLVSIFIFMPVIIWNAEHQWMSFIFQGPRRLRGEISFNLPQLIGSLLLLLTPIGAMSIFSGFNIFKEKIFKAQRNIFFLTFIFCPFSVFFLLSFIRDVKLNWTGPIWLMALPFMAWQMTSAKGELSNRMDLFLRRAWIPTLMTCILTCGALLYFLTLGAPGMSNIKSKNIGYMIGWSNLAVQIEKIEDEVEKITGVEPIIIGMDKNKIASELAYYRSKNCRDCEDEGFLYTTGRNLFGMDSLMFQYWWADHQKNAIEKGQSLILVAGDLDEFHNLHIISSGWVLAGVKELTVEKEKGFPVRKYFYTIATPRN